MDGAEDQIKTWTDVVQKRSKTHKALSDIWAYTGVDFATAKNGIEKILFLQSVELT